MVTNHEFIFSSFAICEPETIAYLSREIFEGSCLIGTSLMDKYTDDIKRFWQAKEYIYVVCGSYLLPTKWKSGLNARTPLARFL
jgi:hypothetical protein